MVAYETIWESLYRRLSRESRDTVKWTCEIKSALVEPFCKLDHVSFMGSGMASDVFNWEPEYLVDVAVSANIPDEEDRELSLRRILLAAEIEWTPRCGGCDFAKLADLRADRKVLVRSVDLRVWAEAEDPEEPTEETKDPALKRDPNHGVIPRFARFLSGHELVPAGEEYLVVLTAHRRLGKADPDHSAAWRIVKAPETSLVTRMEIPRIQRGASRPMKSRSVE